MYECTTAGPGATVWTVGEGANGCQIILLHSHYPSIVKTCSNSGNVESGIGVVNNYDNGNQCYISRLNVTVNHNLIGQTIRCNFTDTNNISTAVGADTISITTGTDT